ncbi:MAG TPA: ATP-binding protein [Polyangia bacterium]|nr:ATP-binding protein [Polyangia bacterium]
MPIPSLRVMRLYLGMAAAVLGVFLLAYYDLHREQERAFAEFSAEQAVLARILANTLDVRIARIRGDLHTAVALADSSHLDTYFRQLVGDRGIYREARLLDRAHPTSPLLLATSAAPPSPTEGPPIVEALAAARELGSGEQLLVLEPTPQAAKSSRGAGRFWFVAVSEVPGRADHLVMLLVDDARFLPVRIMNDPASAGALQTRHLVFQRPDHWIDLDTGRLVTTPWQRAPGPPDQVPAGMENLVAAMEKGEQGSRLLRRDTAAALDLGHRSAVASFAPIRALPGGPWSMAVITSARSVRDRAIIGAWRLGAATALTGLLVSLFGVLVIRAERRSQALAEALRLAEATAALQRQLAQAEKLANTGRLAAGIAHELGTPLGVISGRAEQLLERLPEGPEAEPLRKGFHSILGQVEKVSRIIRQLLDFARVRPIEATRVSPARLLESAAALLEHRFRKAAMTLTIAAPPGMRPVRGDAGQLEQVFVNLLMNAVDAGHPGGWVRIAAQEREGQVCFEVSDDGCGIPAEHLGAVFDPFFTTKKRGQGTGLGLAIVADIVKNHQGTIDIESQVGRGTVVRVQLPAAGLEEGAA